MKYRWKEIVDAIQFNEENPQVEVKQMLRDNIDTHKDIEYFEI